jgi:competence protein ComGC
MADTGIDAVIKLKNTEYCKRYRLKRRLQMQQQTSTSSEPQLDEKQKKAEYDKQHRLKRKFQVHGSVHQL